MRNYFELDQKLDLQKSQSEDIKIYFNNKVL